MSVTLYRTPQSDMGDETTWGAGTVTFFCLLVPLVFAMGGCTLCINRIRLKWSSQHETSQKLEGVIKALQQLQVLLHAENSLTRDTLRESMEQGFLDMAQRVQAVMNKVMTTYEAIGQINQLVLLLKDRMEVYESELNKMLTEFGNSSASGMTKEVKAALQRVTQELGDRIQKDTGGFVMDCQKTLQLALVPIKGAQEKFTATINERFTEVLTEVTNVPYKVAKESKDIQAQVRWAQQTVDRVQSATDHLPDRLGFLRGMLEKVEETLDTITRKLTPADEEVKADSPPGSGAGQREEQGGGQWAQGTPTCYGPKASPTMLNLDASLPMQMVRQNSVLTPVTLADGRVCYIPRSILQQILGHDP
ncbi:unnamed protein product [Symbiodinium sp. KB8]|nr:unnamed protein product [Symbiodinium sp. KB8]